MNLQGVTYTLNVTLKSVQHSLCYMVEVFRETATLYRFRLKLHRIKQFHEKYNSVLLAQWHWEFHATAPSVSACLVTWCNRIVIFPRTGFTKKLTATVHLSLDLAWRLCAFCSAKYSWHFQNVKCLSKHAICLEQDYVHHFAWNLATK